LLWFSLGDERRRRLFRRRCEFGLGCQIKDRFRFGLGFRRRWRFFRFRGRFGFWLFD